MPPTFVSLLTSPGRGAVATLGIDGPDAVGVVARRLRLAARGKVLSDVPRGQIVVGRWAQDDGEEVVVCRVSDGRVELHCHGGAIAATRILEDLREQQCQVVNWSEWILATGGTLFDQELAVALANASTQRTAGILLDQQDAMPRAVQDVLAEIRRGDGPSACRRLQTLLQWSALSLHLTTPWRVVVGGRPNVGKSSLINALVGYERAIVFDQPGTTRDLVTVETAFEGWPVQLIDTAGLRASDCTVEAAGVERSTRQAATADCLLLVFDASQPWSEEDQRLLDRYPTALILHNKQDLCADRRWRPAGMLTSARTGLGLPDLMRCIGQMLVPASPEPQAAGPFTNRQLERLHAAYQACSAGDTTSAGQSIESIVKGS